MGRPLTARPKLTAARVRELLDCDPEAGTLRWRERPGDTDFNRQWAGRLAGGLDPSTGYLRLMIDGRHYYVHRVVWLPRKVTGHRRISITGTAIRPTARLAISARLLRPRTTLTGALDQVRMGPLVGAG